jgi:hypothetical protein
MSKKQDRPGIKQSNSLDLAIAELQKEIADITNREAIFREDWILDVLEVSDYLSIKLGYVTEGKTESGEFWYSRWVEYTFGEDTDVFRVISSGQRQQNIQELNKLAKRRLYYVLLKKYLGVNPRGQEVKDEK